MTAFIAIAAAMGAIALGFALAPLLASPATVRARPRLAATLALLLALLAVAVYRQVGNPAALDDPRPASPDGLAARARAHPADVALWRALAHAQEREGRFAQAVEAYRHLVELTPDDAGLLLDFAVTLGMLGGGQLDGEPEALIEHALAIEPANPQALALSGSVRFERRDYAGAVERWRRVLAGVPPDAEVARSIEAGIARAEALGRGP